MRRILVHESLTGGDAVAGDAECAALLPQGRAMRNAVLADLLRLPDLRITCTVCERPGATELPAHAPGRLGTVQREPGENAVRFIARLAPAHDHVWVIAPETGGLLGRLQQAVGSPRWMGCNAPAIAAASSKRACLLVLAAAGLATPLAFEAAATRWVVKPDDGAGAVDTRVHQDHGLALADLAHRRETGLQATLEPWVDGEALSLSLLSGPGFVQLLAVNRQQIETDAAGALAYRGVLIDVLDLQRDPRAHRLRAVARDVVGALPGLHGLVGIDLVWHARHGPVVIEVNPRVTCAYVGLSAALQRNLAAEVLALHPLPQGQHA